MGTYLNPGNAGFTRIRRSDYVDKTGMIALVNETIGTTRNLICISRPRRFGKSFAAQMLCAYYDQTCDSKALFDGLEISKHASYLEQMNRYHVVYLDMTNVLGEAGDRNVVSFVRDRLRGEIIDLYPSLSETQELSSLMVKAVDLSQVPFVMIIDEWDAPVREHPEIERDYLHFLRTLFKSSGTTAKIFAAVYMTGILPIKKDGSQSAISDFDEFTMIQPRLFGEYVGFTEKEVRDLCRKYGADFDRMKAWYDGYSFKGTGSIYNPNSVMSALRYDDYTSFWTETSASDSLRNYITMDYDGLTKTIAELIGGLKVPVDPFGFANDLTTFYGKDDILTLLIHLGYLAYDAAAGKVRIPNEEIRREFAKSVHMVRHPQTLKRLRESEQLIADTIHGYEDAVAAQIEKVHLEETTPLHYNREDSLRSVIKLAYYAYRDYYLQWEELPAGAGYADVVYLPKRDTDYPALVIELKWNASAEGAIAQILNRRYPQALVEFGGDILLVGINYDKDASAGERKHTCRIVKIEK